MSITWCSVALCKNLASPHKDHQFYRYPEDPELRTIWIKRTHCNEYLVGREAVCCLHFTKDSFDYDEDTNTYSLKPKAYPTQFLPKKRFESDSFPFSPSTLKITKQDAGLHFSELLRKLRESTAEDDQPKRAGNVLTKKDRHAKEILKQEPHIREYVLKEAFPNLNYDALSALLKRFSDKSASVTINHSKANNSIVLRYQTEDPLADKSWARMAPDENVAERSAVRELAEELDFTGEVSFSGDCPNIYKDNFFGKWPAPQRKKRPAKIVFGANEKVDLSTVPPTVVCSKCCRLIPRQVAVVHTQVCSFLMSQCTTCYAGFPWPRELTAHIADTHPEALDAAASSASTGAVGPFQCGKCGTTFFDQDALEQHIADHQAPSSKLQASMECGLCSAAFTDMYELGQHFGQDHAIAGPNRARQRKLGLGRDAKSLFECELCNVMFVTVLELQAHLKEFHEKQPDEIPSSPEPTTATASKPTAKQKPTLRLTKADMGGPEGTFDIFLCKQCPARYRTFKEFTAHSASFKHALLKNCVFCEKEFTDEACYNRHINTHNPERLFRCNLCPARADFATLRELSKHRAKKIHMNDPSVMFRTCDVCNKAVYRPTYGQHKAYHKVNIVMQCTDCDGFYTLSGKKQHMQQHKNDQNSLRKCRFCDTFEPSDMLLEHITIYHPEEYPYACALCPSKQVSQEALKQHVSGCHTKEEMNTLRPTLYNTISVGDAEYYECKLCMVDFSSRKDMIGHIKRCHLVEHRFRCEKCGRQFPKSLQLAEHREVDCLVEYYDEVEVEVE